jgi:hypothetical protein
MEGEQTPFLRHIRQAAQDAHLMSRSEREQQEAQGQALIDQLAQEMQARYQSVVATIPECISCHFSQGRSYGRIMRLRYDESQEDPRWETGFWESHNPDPNRLLHAAMQVFVFCHEHGLKPYLVRDYDFDLQKYFLYLGINCRHHL